MQRLRYSMCVWAAAALMAPRFTVPAFAAGPTFHADIAPILREHCAVCHHAGEVAPFALLTYDDAAKRAGLIATVVGKRYMPPWKPAAGMGHFEGERRLSDEQIELIRRWAAAGAPEGDRRQRLDPPTFASGWRAGEPDVALTPAEPFDVAADGPDIVQCFVIPLTLAEERYVRSVEFHPGNPRVVHHALFFLDGAGEGRKLEGGATGKGYSCFGGPRVRPSGALGGWAPGGAPQKLADGMAFTIAPKTDLILQVHYHPSGRPEKDLSTVGLRFGERPRQGLAHMIAGLRTLDLPAGDAQYESEDWITVPADVDLIAIAPHAHYLCKQMYVDAHLPDGRTEPLIHILDWDFNWQGEYRYAAPVHLPEGTRITLRYVYDNSEENPRNPSSPPKRVTFGEQTTDEMALLFLLVATPELEDVPKFYRAFARGVVDRLVMDDAEPVALTPGQIAGLRAARRHFDANHNGKLEPEERAALLRFLKMAP